MRSGSYTLALGLTGVLALVCSPASAQPYSQQHSGVQVDVGIFYDSLSAHGDWVEMPDYGWSFAPRVDRGWRPYTRGQWVMTDDGWFWDSDENFGWATYHYGRWINHPYYGWVWVPGTEWAPAWVSWRHGNGYTGWAPLPPRAGWQGHIGLNIGGLDLDAFIGARDYAFVPDRSFVDRGVYQRVLPPTQNLTIINVTNNVTNYTVVNQRVHNGGLDAAYVERAVGRRVPHARTFDVDRADFQRRARADEVAVYRPNIRAAAVDRRPAQGRSLVRGEEPPARLVERRKEREQERRQSAELEVTAKEVQVRKQKPTAVPMDARTQQQLDTKAQADKRAEANQQAREEKQATQKQAEQKQLEQQQRNQAQREQQQLAAKAQADKRAEANQQARAQQQAEQQAQQRQSEQKQLEQQQRNQAQREQQQLAAKAQADKRAEANQQAREEKQASQKQAEQKQLEQQQRNQAQREQQQLAAKAQADKRAEANQQARAQQQADQKERSQQQMDQKEARLEAEAQKAKAEKDAKAKGKDKDKGKKSPEPSPTPAPEGHRP